MPSEVHQHVLSITQEKLKASQPPGTEQRPLTKKKKKKLSGKIRPVPRHDEISYHFIIFDTSGSC